MHLFSWNGSAFLCDIEQRIDPSKTCLPSRHAEGPTRRSIRATWHGQKRAVADKITFHNYKVPTHYSRALASTNLNWISNVLEKGIFTAPDYTTRGARKSNKSPSDLFCILSVRKQFNLEFSHWKCRIKLTPTRRNGAQIHKHFAPENFLRNKFHRGRARR